MRIGVLALQGGFAPHASMLERLGHQVVMLRTASDVVDVEGLVLPGGESTAQLRLLEPRLREALTRLVDSGAPVLATCAGAIVAAELGWLRAVIERNANGPQLYSSEGLADDGTPVVLIRAPRFEALSEDVEVLTRLRGDPVLVRDGALFAATFHPELTEDTRVHRLVFSPSRKCAAESRLTNARDQTFASSNTSGSTKM